MIGALIFNIIAVIFAWLESTGQYKHGLKLSLFTVFLFLALRYSYGNDYWNYFYMFMDTNSSSSFGESILREGWEIGWLFINRVFGLLGTQGFFAMIAVLAAFNCIVLFRFIKKYVPPKHYWIAVFIYTFQPDMMLILSSAMRQAVAVSLFLLSIDFIIQKKILPYLILVTIATIFHTSSIVLYTFILLVFGDWKINFRELIIVFVLFMIQFIYFNVIHEYTTLITNKYFWAYTKHLSEAPDLEVVFRLRAALAIFIYTTCIYLSQKETNNTNNLFYKIAIIAILMFPLSNVAGNFARLNYYLLPVFMVVFSVTAIKIKNREFRLIFIGSILTLNLYQFFLFFQSVIWQYYFAEYHTIFSSPYF